MGKTSWQVKKRYNDKVYKRIAVDLPADLVERFKAICREKDVSQAQVIREQIEKWMADD